MYKNVNVNIDAMLKALNELNKEYAQLEETCKKIKECFNRLRDADLKGSAATRMLEICDEWEKINTNRLEQIKILDELLKSSYTAYSEVKQYIRKEVG